MLLEICCGSANDALEAEAGGAGRVELCSSLSVGGLTPPIASIAEATRLLTIPVVVMMRVRAGDFCYSEAEFAAMVADAEAALAHNVAGLVCGVLAEDGAIDLTRTQRLRDLAGARDTVFHRAFDLTPDPFRALDELVDVGITRILTSGRRTTALEGADLIKRLVDYAGERIQIMPGGGIRPSNVDAIVARTGCRQIHSGVIERAVVEQVARAIRPRVIMDDSRLP